MQSGSSGSLSLARWHCSSPPQRPDGAIGIAGAVVAARRWGPIGRLDDWLSKLPPPTLAFGWLLLILAALPFRVVRAVASSSRRDAEPGNGTHAASPP